MARLTHSEVIQFCNMNFDATGGFPLALANFCYDLGLLDAARIDQEAAEQKHQLLNAPSLQWKHPLALAAELAAAESKKPAEAPASFPAEIDRRGKKKPPVDFN